MQLRQIVERFLSAPDTSSSLGSSSRLSAGRQVVRTSISILSWSLRNRSGHLRKTCHSRRDFVLLDEPCGRMEILNTLSSIKAYTLLSMVVSFPEARTAREVHQLPCHWTSAVVTSYLRALHSWSLLEKLSYEVRAGFQMSPMPISKAGSNQVWSATACGPRHDMHGL